MNIRITERQIRLILQEALTAKDVERYVKTDRSEDIEERLSKVYEALKTNPEYIEEDSENERLYFNFEEQVYSEVKGIIGKINAISDKKYILIPELFKQNLLKVEINIPEKFQKKDEYGNVIAGSDKKITEQPLIGTLSKFVNKIDNFDNENFDVIKLKLDKFFDVSRKTKIDLTESDMLVVISKLKYDLAAMSSDRAWEYDSCMRIPTEKNNQNAGGFCSHIIDDIQQGTLIAYVIKSNDKNIENPIARMLIKPFEGKDSLFYKPEEKIYGQYDKTILYTFLVDLLKPVNKDSKEIHYKKNEKLYSDDRKNVVIDYSNFFNKNYTGDTIEYINKYILNNFELIQTIDEIKMNEIMNVIPENMRFDFIIKYIFSNENVLINLIKNHFDLHTFFNFIPKKDRYELVKGIFTNKNCITYFKLDIISTISELNYEERIYFLKNVLFKDGYILRLIDELKTNIIFFNSRIKLNKIINKEDLDEIIKENLLNNESVMSNSNYLYTLYLLITNETNKDEFIKNNIFNNNILFNKLLNIYDSSILQSFFKIFKSNISDENLDYFIEEYTKNLKNNLNKLSDDNIENIIALLLFYCSNKKNYIKNFILTNVKFINIILNNIHLVHNLLDINKDENNIIYTLNDIYENEKLKELSTEMKNNNINNIEELPTFIKKLNKEKVSELINRNVSRSGILEKAVKQGNIIIKLNNLK